jgi:hypothetical protein
MSAARTLATVRRLLSGALSALIRKRVILDVPAAAS